MESVAFAGLGQTNGDEILLMAAAIAIEAPPGDDDLGRKGEQNTGRGGAKETADDFEAPPNLVKPPISPKPNELSPSGRSVIHVNIDLDSSLDTEKLERQLELLRRYGAI